MIRKIELFLSVVLAVLVVFLAADIIQNLPDGAGGPGTEHYLEHKLTDLSEELPYRYDARDYGRNPSVRDQGTLGTCWALAASSAMEAYFLPEESIVFSADHLSMQNYFGKAQNDGGDYTMVMAYLAGWQGPVFEADDPYGDGVSPDGLAPVKHVQEMQMIKDKDYDAIKRAVYRYGAVQSSIYMDLRNAFSSSVYYNRIESSYLYDGSEKSNHDILIIGWDDNYTASRFNRRTVQNGAFICQNSWGTKFGDNGVFYVSYQDVNIGNNCIAYTGIGETDNYDHIYQTDLCGWVGQLGYGDGDCFFANVYEAKSDEQLAAVGMYTTGENSTYSLYVVDEFDDANSFLKRRLLQSGSIEQRGYYTIPLQEEVSLKAGQRYAVVVQIHTPDNDYPAATEYVADEATKMVDISDGEGYISHSGFAWSSSEKDYKCNICLKAFTKDRQEG